MANMPNSSNIRICRTCGSFDERIFNHVDFSLLDWRLRVELAPKQSDWECLPCLTEDEINPIDGKVWR